MKNKKVLLGLAAIAGLCSFWAGGVLFGGLEMPGNNSPRYGFNSLFAKYLQIYRGGAFHRVADVDSTDLLYTPLTRGLTINGVTQDLSTNRTFTISSITGNAGTVTNGVYTTTFNGLGDARYLQSTGGALSGALNGTSISLSGTITAPNYTGLASNSFRLNGFTFDSGIYSSNMEAFVAKYAGQSELRLINAVGMQSFLGLGSNAYNSTPYLDLTTNQTISSGVKTFAVSPIVPTPTNGTDAANKAYVDAVGVVGSGDLTAQTTIGSQTTIATYTAPANGYYRPGVWVNINSITSTNLVVFVQYTDINNTGHNVYFFPETQVSPSMTVAQNYEFSPKDIMVKAGTAISIKTDVAAGGSINFDVSATIQKIR